MAREHEWEVLLHKAETEPIGFDLSDYSDEWGAGFLAGQWSVLEEIKADRLAIPLAGRAPDPRGG